MKRSKSKKHDDDPPRDDAAPAEAPQPGADEPADAAPASSLKEQLEAAVAERDSNRDSWLRTQAELENYRKRVQREVDEFRQYQSLPLARDLLPALDNLRRAIQAAEQSQNVDELVAGVRMVAQQFDEALARNGVTPIESVGKPFDPNLHQALQQVPSAEHPPLTVLQEVERGYVLNDRVVRPSCVIVSQAPPPPPAENAAHSAPEGDNPAAGPADS